MVLKSLRAGAAMLVAFSFARNAAAQRGLLGGDQLTGPRAQLFGFALECERCESTAPGRRGGTGRGLFAVWHYSEFPRVAAVAAGGPAERAGVRVGDIVMSIDGLSLVTDDGSRRLSEVVAGDEVKLGLERGNKTIDVSLTLGRRFARGEGGQAARRGGFGEPFARGARAGRGAEIAIEHVPPYPADYAAHIGSAALEIWSGSPVIASTDSTGATIITIGGTTIRLRGGPALAAGARRGSAPP